MGAVEALLALGVRWEESDAEQLKNIRPGLVKFGDYELR